MNDIVERLRSPEVFIDTGGMTSPVAHLAADEIERLRAERDMWRQENLKKQIACEQMGARIVTLEAARDAARREGIEAAWGVVADEPVPEGKLTFHEVMQRDERMMERIRALLEDGR